MLKELSYDTTEMLPTIDYNKLEDNIFGGNLVDLEFQTMNNLCDFVEKLKEIMLKNNMVQIPELIIANLAAYLGVLTVYCLGLEQSETLYPQIIKLLENQANIAIKKFTKYAVRGDKTQTQEDRTANLEKLRNNTPSSIIAQTLRLGRVVFDTLEELSHNHKRNPYKPEKMEPFCPQDEFFELLLEFIPENVQKDEIEGPLYLVNQTIVQLAWLIGYFTHLDDVKTPENYLKYATNCIKLYIDYGNKFLTKCEIDFPITTISEEDHIKGDKINLAEIENFLFNEILDGPKLNEPTKQKKKKTLTEMVETAKTLDFPKLPKGITFKKELLRSNDRDIWGYTFRDEKIGELGRILFLPVGNETQLVAEVTGSHDDPLTKKRKELFEPISREIIDKMGLACGGGNTPIQPYESPKRCIESRVFPCETCNKVTSMLIFADNATTTNDLENYARMMQEKITELKVPTWIIGDESENIVNGEDLRKSLVMKISKKKRETRIMIPDEIMDEVDSLMDNHCATRKYKK